MPGAYLRCAARTTTLGVVIDATANQGCPAASMPVVEYSVDDGPFTVVPLTRTGEVYTLCLADGLAADVPHHAEFFFRAADLSQERWRSSIDHLRLAGLALDDGGTLLPVPRRPKNAIGFGDSITEGVGIDGFFASWQKLEVNNARSTWLPLVCNALGCEYGQLGSGGQGMVNKTMAVPPFGWHLAEIQAAVAARTRAGDGRVHVIDTAPLKDGFDIRNRPSRLAHDGCHPSLYGSALLGALVATEVQKILSCR